VTAAFPNIAFVHDRALRLGACPLVLAAALFACLLAPVPARALIHPASVLDGPANDILEVDGAAMAPDGTGGVVYRKEVEGGIAHVFVVPFANGRWGGPIAVDTEDVYGASEPAIAAGEGGRLLVVWVQRRNVSTGGVTLYELMGASLQPGADGFGQAVAIDTSVGEPYTGDISAVDPTLAMAPDGAAYVVYRVITDDCSRVAGDPESSLCPPSNPTDKLVDVRVARFQYLTWSSPVTINRAAAQVAMPDPTPENAPAIGIALNGNGVVVWQEPEASGGVARIWARRLFATVLGNVLQASPETIGGRPVTSDAEAPALAVGPFGEARIAYRIHGEPGSAVSTTQLYVNSILSEIAPHGSQLQGAVPVPGAVQNGLGVPSDAIDQQEGFRIAWTQGGAALELTGGANTTGSPVAVGAAGGRALTSINPAGGGTTTWQAPVGAAPAVEVREDYARGAYQTAQLAGAIAGPISGLALGGDGQGDALIGFAQGPPGRSEVLGDFVQAPPAPFTVDTPAGWVRGGAVSIGWEVAPDAVTGVTYAVYVDGKPRIEGLTGLTASLSAARLGDGAHKVQVLATDASGQQTMSAASELKIDANPPIVRIRPIDDRRGVRVTVTDHASGVDKAATVVSFGDGHTTRRRDTVTHEYEHAGTYWITAHVRNNVGNHATVHIRVRVR
jgi:hypothetical protein